MITFKVPNPNIHSFSHGSEIFPVEDGTVTLPSDAKWWHDLLDAGTLVHVDPEELPKGKKPAGKKPAETPAEE